MARHSSESRSHLYVRGTKPPHTMRAYAVVSHTNPHLPTPTSTPSHLPSSVYTHERLVHSRSSRRALNSTRPQRQILKACQARRSRQGKHDHKNGSVDLQHCGGALWVPGVPRLDERALVVGLLSKGGTEIWRETLQGRASTFGHGWAEHGKPAGAWQMGARRVKDCMTVWGAAALGIICAHRHGLARASPPATHTISYLHPHRPLRRRPPLGRVAEVLHP